MDLLEKKAQEALEYVRSQSEHIFHVKAAGLSPMDPAECKRLCKTINFEYREGLEQRVVKFRFTDATCDSYNEVVIPKGMDLTLYRKNPVVFWVHNSHSFPVGRTLKVQYNKDTDDVIGYVMFLDDEIDRSGVSEDVFRFVKSGAITTGSVGFSCKPDDIRRATPEEMIKYGTDRYGLIFDKTVLKEFSIAPLPANHNAEKLKFRSETEKHLSGQPVPLETEKSEPESKTPVILYVKAGQDVKDTIKSLKNIAELSQAGFEIEVREDDNSINDELTQINQKLDEIVPLFKKAAEQPPVPDGIHKGLSDEQETEVLYLFDKAISNLKGEPNGSRKKDGRET